MDEKKDLNTNQTVTDSGLKEQPATAPDLNSQVVTDEQAETLADGTPVDKSVPYDEMKKAIDSKNAAEEKTRLLQAQVQVMQANQQETVQQAPLSDYDQARVDVGLGGEEFLEESQRGKIYTRMNEITNIRQNQTNALIANQQFESIHPDFSTVVGNRNHLGQIAPSAEIMKILTEKPYLTASVYSSSQAAYDIVMRERELTELKKLNIVNKEHLDQQEIESKLGPISAAAVSGGGISDKTAGTITLKQQLENEQRVADG